MRPAARPLAIAPVLALTAALLSAPSSTAAPAAEHGRLVNGVPSTATPNIVNGTTYSIAKLGDKIYVGGSFTQVSNRGSDNVWTRNRLLAFDASTGKLDSTFTPDMDGTVSAVIPGPSGTLYVGGAFKTVNGATVRNLTRLDADTGDVMPGFSAVPFNGAVNTLHDTGSRLLVGGNFTTAGGAKHGGLVSVSRAYGKLDDYLSVDVAGHHNWTGLPGTAKGAVGVRDIAVSPDGESLVAIGNFTSADELPRDQIMRVDLGDTPAVDPDWASPTYEAPCNPVTFDSYIRDVDFSPDGSYFGVASTGGYGDNDAACDTANRFEADASGTDVRPTWVSRTGADTLLGLEITDKALYVGGHQRWLNNANGRDAAGTGAVPRPGIGALDPRTGLPLSWNPGRNPRGQGASELMATDDGLYVGSDTKYIGNRKYLRGKIAFFPVAGGVGVPTEDTGTLPSDLMFAGADGVAKKRSFDGTDVGSTSTVPGAGSWVNVRGGFMVNGTMYYGNANGSMYKRTFDGSSFGTVTAIDPYNDPAWANVETGSGQTYRGQPPYLYRELADVGGMAYRDGRLYYTLVDRPGLFYRYFSPQSGVLSATEVKASSDSRWNTAGGMFVTGDYLYWASRTTGDLYRTAWADGKPDGAMTTISGPTVDGNDWKTKVIFLVAGA